MKLGHVAGTEIQSTFGIAMARKALDAAKVEGKAAMKLIETAGQVQASAPTQTVTPTKVDVRV